MTLASRSRIGPSFLGAPNSTSSGRVITYVFQLKKSYHQIGPPSRWKGVGTDLSLLANHK